MIDAHGHKKPCVAIALEGIPLDECMTVK